MTKKWYKSKTFRVNILIILAMIAQIYFKKNLISEEIQVLLLGIINLILRTITSEKIEF